MASRSQSSDVEILVHVAAPSKTTDDAHYRQLAQAYLSFQPQARNKLSLIKGRGSVVDSQCPGISTSKHAGNWSAPESSNQEFATPVPESTTFGPDSQDLSFQSALDNRLSPQLRLREQNARSALVPSVSSAGLSRSQETPSSWHPPPSQISDSYPMPEANAVNITPTRVLQRYLHQRGPSRPSSPTSSPSPTAALAQNDRQPAASSQDIEIPSSVPIADSEQQVHLLRQCMDTQNVIPVTPNVPRVWLHKRRWPAMGEADDECEDVSVIDITHISSSSIGQCSHNSLQRAESEPRPSKRPKTSPENSDPTILVRSFSDTGPVRSKAPFLTDTRPDAHPDAHQDAHPDTLEIRSPSPPVGITNIDPTSLISDKLAKLARDLSSRYRPTVERTIEPFERGYWLIDCTSWSASARLDTWVFLDNYLRSGITGWGVWCRRDSSHDWIRIYGWGHIVKHTYLLMYLASERHIKTTGSQWYGADGEVAITVPSK